MDYEVTAEVGAPAEKVWALLADLEGWPGWTASMQQLQPLDDGPPGVGTRVRVRQPSLPTAVWTITAWEPGTGFTWEARNPGLVTAADHELAETGGRTTVALRVRQKGFLAPLVHLLIGKRTRRYIRIEADGLAARAQSG